MFMKFGKDEVLMAVYALRCFSHICPGVDPGQGMGVPILRKLFFSPEGYSNKPNA